MIQEKKCKPQGQMKGIEGCGRLTDVRYIKYGACSNCYWNWMQENENGKVHYQKQFLPQAKAKVKKNERDQKREQKINLLTADQYRSKYLQPTINKTARLIDFGCSCIATDNFGKMNGGHYRSVGSNRTIALNLHNIHIQSFQSNTFRGGDDKNYKDGLIDRYGIEYFDFVDALRQQKPLHLTLDDMKELNVKAKAINLTLEKQQTERIPEERINLRNQVNKDLGIYDEQFSTFKTEIRCK